MIILPLCSAVAVVLLHVPTSRLHIPEGHPRNDVHRREWRKSEHPRYAPRQDHIGAQRREFGRTAGVLDSPSFLGLPSQPVLQEHSTPLKPFPGLIARSWTLESNFIHAMSSPTHFILYPGRVGFIMARLILSQTEGKTVAMYFWTPFGSAISRINICSVRHPSFWPNHSLPSKELPPYSEPYELRISESASSHKRIGHGSPQTG